MSAIKNRVTKDKLIKILAKKNNTDTITARSFYNKFEETIIELLSTVDNESPISIKLFDGISLEGTFIPAQEKMNNLTGKLNFVESKIKPKFKITRSFIDKLNVIN